MQNEHFCHLKVNFVVMELKKLSPSLPHRVFYKSTPTAAGIITGLVLEAENKQDGSLSCKPELGVLFLFPWLSKLHWELMENWLCLSHSLRLVTRPFCLFFTHLLVGPKRYAWPLCLPSEQTHKYILVINSNNSHKSSNDSHNAIYLLDVVIKWYHSCEQGMCVQMCVLGIWGGMLWRLHARESTRGEFDG